MRMYLSSFRIGNCPERLVMMAGANARVGVIANSLEQMRDDARRSRPMRESVIRLPAPRFR